MQQPTQPVPAVQPAKPKPPEPPPEFQEGDISSMDVATLIRILTDPRSSEFQRAKASQRIGELGDKGGVPALAALLGDEHLSTYARYGLEPIADPSVDDALRASVSKLTGNLLIGVINSIGKRRNAKSGPALVKMLHGADEEVAAAAAAALGNIGDGFAAKELKIALEKTKGLTRLAVADGALICAERLLADGKREEGLALYTLLTGQNIPAPARLAAMAGIIREETSLTRPR